MYAAHLRRYQGEAVCETAELENNRVSWRNDDLAVLVEGADPCVDSQGSCGCSLAILGRVRPRMCNKQPE